MAMQSNSGEGAPVSLGKLRLCAYAAMFVALFLAFSTVIQTIRGTNLWMLTQVDSETAASNGAPFDLEYAEQERSRSAQLAMRSIAVGILLAACGLACGYYAWQLRMASLGRRPVEGTLTGQTICWYLAAALSVLYLISHIWVF